MTISSETTKQTFLGNGAQSVFTYTFLLPTAAQYTLHYVDAAGAISLVSQADYTVSGIGVATGGSLTYLRGGSPIASGTSITLVRAVPYTQTTELNNQGAYYPTVIEQALDRLDMQVQQLYATSRLSFKAPVTNANVADVPTASERADSWAYWDADGNLTSTTTAWPGSPALILEITGGQTIEAQPTGNPVDTLSSFTVTGETVSEVEREFLVSIGFISNKGEAAASPERDKVALYVGMIADDGTGDAWSFNTVNSLFPGATAYNAFGYELDFNNLNGHRGDTPGAAGLAAPVSYGLAITGANSFRNTAAILLTGTTGSWNRGIVTTGVIAQSVFQDFGIPERFLDLRGTYDTAIDISTANATVAMALAADSPIKGGGVHLLSFSSGTNVVLMGESGVSFNVEGDDFSPLTNNATSLGISGQRWSEVYAVNGTINTSDVRQKNSIKRMEKKGGMTRLLREVEPITFKFNEGGATIETVTEQKLLPVYEEVAVEVEESVLGQDGKARMVKTPRVEKRRVMDSFPVVDENGFQIIDWTKPVKDKTGRIIRGPQPVPRVKKVPRLDYQTVVVKRAVSRPGVREHYGFAAEDFKGAFEKLGFGDFGGYVKGQDGIEGLRDHQITALLWQIVREMDARIVELEYA